MIRKPTVAVAWVPQLNEHLMTAAHWQRLDALTVVLDREPLTTFADDRATLLLPQTEILMTGWGCARVDVHVLERMPQLRAIVHAAGTVKLHLSEACWERGILVTS